MMRLPGGAAALPGPLCARAYHAMRGDPRWGRRGDLQKFLRARGILRRGLDVGLRSVTTRGRLDVPFALGRPLIECPRTPCDALLAGRPAVRRQRTCGV